MKTISIVLPVYNEEDGLPQFHQALALVLNSFDYRYSFEVIYILDRSRDNSFEVLRKIAAGDGRVRVIHLSRRFGHQMSLVAGIDHSRGDAVIMMDCDLQHPPAIIRDLIRQFEQGYEIVHTIRTYGAGVGPLKRVTSRLFYRIQNALSPIEIPEGAADFRLVSRRVADVFRSSIREHNQFLRGLFRWVGFKSTAVPFVSAARAAGETKYRFLTLFAFMGAGMTSFSKFPLRIGTFLGAGISLLSLMYGLVVVIQYLLSGSFPPGYTSLFVAVLFIGGLQMIVLGVIGEYVGGIFDEVKSRPLYIVEETIEGGPVA